ncbi:uncharacterized protein LOC106648447 [Trichogramma pretiosum]|uniref:uncharacterized protein LOC106648447 n=1 Tax=Trichogramma pretiosum TaxID=7493 RepID=UPI0006C97F23|nr:uncharacterized protein LOC106648447 [Trichogramma pretiosum]
MPIIADFVETIRTIHIGHFQKPQKAIMDLPEKLSFSTELKLPKSLKQRQPLSATRKNCSSEEPMPKLSKLNIRKRSIGSRRIWHPCVCSARKLPPNADKLALALSFELESDDGQKLKHQSVEPILVPKNATIYRTVSRTRPYSFGIFVHEVPLVYLSGRDETECQRYMYKIRRLLRPRRIRRLDDSFEVSIIDNKQSRSHGLTGLHADMIVRRNGIYFKDVHDGAMLLYMCWKQIKGASVAHPETTDGDLDNQVILHTTEMFDTDRCDIKFFCEEGDQLVRLIKASGKVYREFRLRPLSDSVSEGDLTSSPAQSCNPKKIKTFDIKQTKVDESKRIMKAPAWDLILNRSGSEAKLNKNNSSGLRFPNLRIQSIPSPSVTTSCEELEETATKSDSNATTTAAIPFSNLRIQPVSPPSATSSCDELEKIKTISGSEKLEKIKTISGSEKLEKIKTISGSEELEEIKTISGSEELETISSISHCKESEKSTVSRRDSNVSMCSGIYEEIAESHLGSVCSLESRHSNVYENLIDFVLNLAEKLEPPPLPPRSRTISSSTTSTYAGGSISDSGFESEGCILPYNDDNYLSAAEDKSPIKSIKSREPPRDTSEYVPMMPRTTQMIMQDKQKKRAQNTSSESIYVAMR